MLSISSSNGSNVPAWKWFPSSVDFWQMRLQVKTPAGVWIEIIPLESGSNGNCWYISYISLFARTKLPPTDWHMVSRSCILDAFESLIEFTPWTSTINYILFDSDFRTAVARLLHNDASFRIIFQMFSKQFCLSSGVLLLSLHVFSWGSNTVAHLDSYRQSTA